MTTKHWAEIAALVMIGEGVIGVVHPEKHLSLWRVGPKPFRELMDELSARPSVLRLAFAAQILLGYCLARRQFEK